MNALKTSAIGNFYQELLESIQNGEEISIRQIYSLFPDDNQKTISWRVHKLVQQGLLQSTGHSYYALHAPNRDSAAGYAHMQRKTQEVYDAVVDYPYDFFVTGMDSLVGELLHIPEMYTVLLAVEEAGVFDTQDVLGDSGFIAFTEKDRGLLGNHSLKDKADVVILKGKDFTLSSEHIAHKEQGFVDLYYAATRLDYGISIPELSRIYRSLQRNRSLAKEKMKRAAKERGVSIEISWLMEIDRASEKTLEFMSHQMSVNRDSLLR